MPPKGIESYTMLYTYGGIAMTKQDLADHFGSIAAAARALGRTRGALSQWPDELPERVQFEIEGRTKGRLKVDPELRSKRVA